MEQVALGESLVIIDEILISLLNYLDDKNTDNTISFK